MVIRYDNYNSLWSYATAFTSKLQIDLKIQQTNAFFLVLFHQWLHSDAEILNTWACSQWGLCHRVQQQDCQTVSDLAPGHTENQWESENKPASPGAQRCSLSTERYCWRSVRLCHKTCSKASVQFSRTLTRNLRKLIFSTKFYRVLPKEI